MSGRAVRIVHELPEVVDTDPLALRGRTGQQQRGEHERLQHTEKLRSEKINMKNFTL